MAIISKGRVFALTHGSYSEYEFDALCLALTDLDMATLEAEYKAFFFPPGDARHRLSGDRYGFAGWLLVKRGDLVMELPMAELSWGSPGDKHILSLEIHPDDEISKYKGWIARWLGFGGQKEDASRS